MKRKPFFRYALLILVLVVATGLFNVVCVSSFSEKSNTIENQIDAKATMILTSFDLHSRKCSYNLRLEITGNHSSIFGNNSTIPIYTISYSDFLNLRSYNTSGLNTIYIHFVESRYVGNGRVEVWGSETNILVKDWEFDKSYGGYSEYFPFDQYIVWPTIIFPPPVNPQAIPKFNWSFEADLYTFGWEKIESGIYPLGGYSYQELPRNLINMSVTFEVTFGRRDSDLYLIMLPIVGAFVLLGLLLFISDFNSRIMTTTTLFVFAASLLFSQQASIPPRIGLTIFENLVVGIFSFALAVSIISIVCEKAKSHSNLKSLLEILAISSVLGYFSYMAAQYVAYAFISPWGALWYIFPTLRKALDCIFLVLLIFIVFLIVKILPYVNALSEKAFSVMERIKNRRYRQFLHISCFTAFLVFAWLFLDSLILARNPEFFHILYLIGLIVLGALFLESSGIIDIIRSFNQKTRRQE